MHVPAATPLLHTVLCSGAANLAHGTQVPRDCHHMAYWEWNATGNPNHSHVIVCVHGLTRQGRDFDVLAQQLSQYARVICPDVVGRGHSDWLADPLMYGMPQYTLDMVAMLQQEHARSPIGQLDWLGTSMGGLIGMCLAGMQSLALPVPIRRLLLNDVGPVLEWSALQRIASYVGHNPRFDSLQEGYDALRAISLGFGPHTQSQWAALSQPMLRRLKTGGWGLHYDPAIARPMQHLTRDQSAQGQTLLWQLFDAIKAQTLLVRGAESDLIRPSTAQAMQRRGPRARVWELTGVGHAPTFVSDDQVTIAQAFFLGDE